MLGGFLTAAQSAIGALPSRQSSQTTSPSTANANAGYDAELLPIPAKEKQSWASASSMDGAQTEEQQIAEFLRLKNETDQQEAADYDEELQEAMYLRSLEPLPLPEKNTFIHFKITNPSLILDAPLQEQNWPSAPPDMLTQPFQTKHPAMEQAHVRGECKPCAYYLYKEDGCRQGADCQFCHLCKKGDVKRKKLEKKKALKAAAKARNGIEAEAADDASDADD